KPPPPALGPHLRIVRLDQGFELRPRHDGGHLRQEHVALRALLLRRKVERRKAQLVHGSPRESIPPVCHVRGLVQRFLRLLRDGAEKPGPVTLSSLGASLEKWIASNQAALVVTTRQTAPIEWARIQEELATAYWNSYRGNRADNIEKAIVSIEAALSIFTPTA